MDSNRSPFHVHTKIYIHPHLEEASIITYSSFVCRHIRDICLCKRQVHLQQVCPAVEWLEVRKKKKTKESKRKWLEVRREVEMVKR